MPTLEAGSRTERHVHALRVGKEEQQSDTLRTVSADGYLTSRERSARVGRALGIHLSHARRVFAAA